MVRRASNLLSVIASDRRERGNPTRGRCEGVARGNLRVPSLRSGQGFGRFLPTAGRHSLAMTFRHSLSRGRVGVGEIWILEFDEGSAHARIV